MSLPAEPRLYRARDDRPVLLASRCASCGRIAFPPIAIGCDACGAGEDGLEAIEIEARGTVQAVATVHVGTFTVVEVELDTGPLIRAVLAPDADVSIGDRVAAGWMVNQQDEDGRDVVEPAFAPVTR
jgi:hypothetical protein